jgi:hypothetical protein
MVIIYLPTKLSPPWGAMSIIPLLYTESFIKKKVLYWYLANNLLQAYWKIVDKREPPWVVARALEILLHVWSSHVATNRTNKTKAFIFLQNDHTEYFVFWSQNIMVYAYMPQILWGHLESNLNSNLDEFTWWFQSFWFLFFFFLQVSSSLYDIPKSNWPLKLGHSGMILTFCNYSID